MLNKTTTTILFTLINLLFSHAVLSENSSQRLDEILSLKQAPSGIIFEIVTGSEHSLKWALPKAKEYIKKLRTVYPNIEIAIVTHGNEQFALKKTNDKKYKKIHSLTQQLVQEENIPLHVCATYAAMKNVGEEEFPDYVDVTAAGPATINDYIALGYLLIKL